MNYFNQKDVLTQDLADYLGVSVPFAANLINNYPNNAIAEGSISVPNLWKWMYGHRDGTPDEHSYFYAMCFPYLGDLANFASQFDFNKANARDFARGRCLDFGGGIGTVGLDMAELGEVDHVDVVDVAVPSLDFLKWRIRKHGIQKLAVVEPTDTPTMRRSSVDCLKGKYDFIYARDCFEHIHDRVEVMEKLLNHLADGGVICEASPIFEYDDTVGKENITKKEYEIWDLLKDRGFELIKQEWTGGFSDGYTNCWIKR